MQQEVLSQLINSKWAASPQAAHSILPFIANMLKGNMSFQEELKRPDKSAFGYMIDQEGNRFRESENNNNLIGVIHISGFMYRYGNWWYYGADELVAMAQNYENDPNVIGHLWVTDSGGGQVSSISPYLGFHAIRKKPLITIADTCASAAIYSAAPSDKLYAGNDLSSMFGSIGVTTTLLNYDKWLESQGLKEIVVNAITSDYKNASYYKALAGDPKDFQEEHLNPLDQKFMDDMLTYRPSIQADVEGILNGKMFYAQDAIDYGLIDGVRTMQECIEELHDMASRKNIATNFMSN